MTLKLRLSPWTDERRTNDLFGHTDDNVGQREGFIIIKIVQKIITKKEKKMNFKFEESMPLCWQIDGHIVHDVVHVRSSFLVFLVEELEVLLL